MTLVTMNFRAELHAYTAWAKASGYSPATVRLRRVYLTRLSEAHNNGPIAKLTTGDLLDFLSYEGWKPETRRSVRTTLRSFFKWATEAELISRDPTAKLPAVRVPTAHPRPTPESIVEAALTASDERTQRMIVLAAWAGLRRAEIAGLHTDDLDDGYLTVCGKGGRTRRIPAHPRVVQKLAGLPAGWVFPGAKAGSHMSAGYIGGILSRQLGPGWSGHTLRHRFSSQAYKGQRDLRAVQLLLGHSSVATTQRYVQVPDDALVEAVRAIA